MESNSSTCSGGVEGASDGSELGVCTCACGDVRSPDKVEARRVEFVDAEEVVESSGSSTTFQVCSVASGAKDTLRLAAIN